MAEPGSYLWSDGGKGDDVERCRHWIDTSSSTLMYMCVHVCIRQLMLRYDNSTKYDNDT